MATETFSHIKTVKSFANEDGETERYRGRLDNTYRINQMESVAYAVKMWSSTVSVHRKALTLRFIKGNITILNQKSCLMDA